MEKSGSQTGLKIISIITIVIAVLSIISGAFIFLGGGAAGQQGEVSTAEMLVLIGIMAIFGGIVDLIVGILGVRGANDPSKIGPFRIIAIIGLVIAILGLISDFMGGASMSSYGSSICQLVIMVLCVYFANNIKNQQ